MYINEIEAILTCCRFVEPQQVASQRLRNFLGTTSMHWKSTPLICIDGWSDVITISNNWKEHLENNKHWNDDIVSVFIFDEAQLTYRDMGLWNTLFKPISDNPSILHHCIITFLSYGCPTRINTPGTLMHIKEL